MKTLNHGLGLAIAASLWVTGCSLGGNVTDDLPDLRFANPTDGALLTGTDDVNPLSDGIQVDVRVDARGYEDGTELTLTSGAVVSTSQLSDGVAIFSDTTLPEGQATLRVTTSGYNGGACDGTTCREITVAALSSGCYITTPQDGSTLTEDSNPSTGDDNFDPFEANVNVACVNPPIGGTVVLSVGGVQVASQEITPAAIQFENVILQDGLNTLGLDTIAADGVTTITSLTSTVTVDRSQTEGFCDVTIATVSPDNIAEGGIFTSASDENAELEGLQRGFVVTTTCTGDGLFVRLYAGEGEDPNDYGTAIATNEAGVAADGGTTFTLSDVTLVDGIWNVCAELRGEGADAEKRGSACYTVAGGSIVDTTPPAVSGITYKDESGCVSAISDIDNDLSNGLQVAVTVSWPSAESGATLNLRAIDSQGAASACTEDADCNVNVGEVCGQFNGEATGSCMYTASGENVTQLSLASVQLVLPQGALEYTVADALGNATNPPAVSNYATRAEAGGDQSIAIDVADGSYLNKASQIVCSSTESNSNAVCDTLDFQGSTTVELFEVPVTVDNVLAGSLVTLQASSTGLDSISSTYTIAEDDLSGASTTVNVYLRNVPDATWTLAATVADVFANDQSCGAETSATPVSVTIDTMGISLSQRAITIAGGTIAESVETTCVGPFQDKNLDLSDGSLNTTGIGVGDLTDGLQIGLLVEFGAQDTGTLYYAFGSEHQLSANTCDAVTPCESGKSCIEGFCYRSVGFENQALAEVSSVRIPAGESGRSDTLKFAFEDAAANITGALAEPFAPYSIAINRIFDSVPALGVSSPATLGNDAAGSASVTITKGTEWDIDGEAAVTTLYLNPASTTTASIGSLGIGRLTGGSPIGTATADGTITVDGLDDGVATFLPVMTDPCAAVLGVSNPYLIYPSQQASTIVFSGASFAAELQTAGRTLASGDKTSQATLDANVTVAAVSDALSASGIQAQLAVFTGTNSGGSCSFLGGASSTGEVAAGQTSTSLNVSLRSDGDTCIQVRYADGINGSLNSCQEGFCTEWVVTQVEDSAVPQCTLATPVNGETVVDADDATNGFQIVPTLEVSGDATAFSYGTTVANIEIRDGGTTGAAVANATLEINVTEAGTLNITGMPDLTYGRDYGIVASCTTTLGGSDAITGDLSANAFSVPTNLDFPVSVTGSFEARYTTANLPTSVVLSKSDEATVSSCTLSLNNNPVSTFLWPETGGVQDSEVTRTFDASPLPEGQAKVTIVCDQGATPGKPIYRYFYVDNTAPSESAVTYAGALADASAVNGNFADGAPLVGSSAFTLTLDMDEAVETLGTAGDTTTLLEGDDEERSSRPDVGTDSYTVSAVVTDAGGTALEAVNGVVTAANSSPSLALDLGTISGAASIAVTVTDEAGNVANLGPYTVNVDLEAPTVAITIPDGLVEVVDGVLPGSIPIYSGTSDSSTLLSDFQLRFTVATTGTNGDEQIDISFSGGPTGFTIAPISTTLDGTSTLVTNHLTFWDSVDSDAGTVDVPYQVTASVTDAVGNTSSVTYAFDVFVNVPTIEWNNPPTILTAVSDEDGAAGLQRRLYNNGASFLVGGTITLCIASLDGSDVIVDGNPLTSACQVGLESNPDANAVSVSKTEASTAGVIYRGFALAPTEPNLFSLPEGTYYLHWEGDRTAELGEDLGRDWSSWRKITIDSVSPTVTLDESVTSPITVGSAKATKDNTIVLTLNSSEDLASMTVVTDNPAPNTSVACSADFTTATAPTCAITLSDGEHNLTVSYADAVGNSGSIAAAQTYLVDTVAGAAAMGLPIVGTIVGSDVSGAVVEAGEAWQKATLAGITVSADGTDPTLENGKLTIDVYAADGNDGTSAFTSCEITLTGDALTEVQNSNELVVTTCDDASTFQIPQGVSFARVSFEDAVGNTNVPGSSWRQISADFVAPTISVFTVADKDGTATVACNASSGCVPDLLDLGAGAYQEAGTLNVFLDADGSSACPSLYSDFLTAAGDACNDNGTDFQIQVDDCVAPSFNNSVIESCDAGSSSVTLTTRVNNDGASTAAFASLSATPSSGDISAAFDAQRSIFGAPFAAASAVGIAPGLIREFQLVVVDDNGNTTTSGSVYLNVCSSGVVADLVAVADSGSTQTLSDNGFLNGTYLTEVDATSSTADLRLDITAQGGETVTNVTLTNPDGSTTDVAAVDNGGGSFTATFNGVSFSTVSEADGSTVNAVSASIVCGGSACGSVSVTGITADGSAPTWQWDRHSLCELNVALSDNTICNSQAAADAETATPTAGGNLTSTEANWNKALDANAATSAFDLSAAKPLKVKLSGLAVDSNVTLAVSSGSVGGTATVATTGCPADCTATFEAANFATLSDDGTYSITVTATDSAGNAAVPRSERTAADATETLIAAVDTLAPTAPTFSVCVGDTTVAGNSVFEDVAACGAACTATNSCSRLAGKATLIFTAPSDDGDGSGTGTVAAYTAYAVARGFSYDGNATDTYTACSQIDVDTFSENAVSVTDSAVAPGGTVNLAFTGLFPHRDYCFVLTSADSSANVAASATVERSFALRGSDGTSVAATSYDATDTMDTRGALENITALGSGSVVSYNPSQGLLLQDFDGDALPDYVYWINNNKTDGSNDRYSELRFYLSAGGYSQAMPIVLKTNHSSSSRNSRVVGQNMFVSGDFNGDGLTDVALSNHKISSGAGSSAGGFLVYLGQAPATDWYLSATADTTSFNVTPSLNAQSDLASAQLCSGGAAVDFDGDGRDEIVCRRTIGGAVSVAGYDLVDGGGNFLTGTQTVDAGGGTGTIASSFTISTKTSGSSSQFAAVIGGADFNGDGREEVLVADSFTLHDAVAESDSNCPPASGSECGEVYVFDTTAGGDLGAPPSDTSTTNSNLVSTLRGPSGNGSAFGQALTTILSPIAGDTADWILVEQIGNPVLFRGSSTATTPGLQPSAYPASGGGALVTGDFPDFPVSFRGITASSYSGYQVLGSIDGKVHLGANSTTGNYTVRISLSSGSPLVEAVTTDTCTGGTVTTCGRYLESENASSDRFGAAVVETSSGYSLITLD